MRVFRLEHPDYGTPYRIDWDKLAYDIEAGHKTQDWEQLISDIQWEMKKAHACPARPAAPEEFARSFRESKHYCGCTSLKDLKEWFSGKGGWSKWLRHGWKVVEYEVEHKYVKQGILQCIFVMEHATRISSSQGV